MRTTIRKVGFWRSEYEPDLPSPERYVGEWDRDGFMSALRVVESTTKCVYFKGYSPCRMCSKSNGSGEYSRDGWMWPSGLAHYVAEHGVKPDDEFVSWVMSNKKK